MPCPTITSSSRFSQESLTINSQKSCATGHVPSRQGGRGQSRRLSRPACRFEDRGRPPAHRAPRSPAGARGDGRHRSGRRPPAACTRSRGGRYLGAGSLRRCCGQHAPLQVDRDTAADPLPERDLDRRLLRGAAGAARQRCWRVVGIRDRQAAGRRIDEHAAWQKRDLSAKRYIYIWADGIHSKHRPHSASSDRLCICLRMNSPATSLVGSGGWPGPVRHTELKRFARKSQSISAASRTSG
jgi:hypothetical protein